MAQPWWDMGRAEQPFPEVDDDRVAVTPEGMARAFHEAYETFAPAFGYRTREASAVPWEEVPEANKALMIATVRNVLIEQKLVIR